jgi:hypothetical protein
MQHASAAVDEARRAEFFRKGGAARVLVKGKRWLLLSRWVNLNTQKKQQLNALFVLNRRVMKAYRPQESLDRLWSYRYEGAMLRYLNSWIDQLSPAGTYPSFGNAILPRGYEPLFKPGGCPNS